VESLLTMCQLFSAIRFDLKNNIKKKLFSIHPTVHCQYSYKHWHQFTLWPALSGVCDFGKHCRWRRSLKRVSSFRRWSVNWRFPPTSPTCSTESAVSIWIPDPLKLSLLIAWNNGCRPMKLVKALSWCIGLHRKLSRCAALQRHLT